MGSYCSTCAITNLPIERRDPVVGFVLGKAYGYRSPGVTGFTGASPFWQAVSLPFRGRYDDYGFVAPETLDRGQAPMSLKAATGVDFSAIEASADSERDSVDVEADLGHPYGKSKLMIMLVHAEVFAALSARTEGHIGDVKRFDVEAARFDEFMDAAARIARDKDSPTASLLKPGESFMMLGDFVEQWTRDTGRNWTEVPEVSRFFGRNRCEGVHSKLQINLARLLGRMHGEGRIGEAHAMLAECLRTAIFDQNLQLLRRQWQPQGGLGSDDRSYDLHAEVAAFTAKHCAIRSSDDYDGPEDDEETTSPAP